MLNFICKVWLVLGILVSSSYSAEDSKDVLVIGTNPYLEWDSWRSANISDETELKTQLSQNEFKIHRFEVIGDEENEIIENFSMKHLKYFDLITNDYCVSHLIPDSSLRSLVKTLKIGGKIVFGPMATYSSIMVMGEDNLQFLTSDFLNADISFVRASAGIYNVCKAISISPTIKENEQEELGYKEDLIVRLSGAIIYDELKDAFIESAKKTCEYHTFSNFKKFMEESKIPLEIRVKRSDIEEPKMVAETILSSNHPGKKFGTGDWLVITRTGE